MGNYQPTMWCPEHKGQSRVTLRRICRDLWYDEHNQLQIEPLDEYWDEEGKLHLHYQYLCSKGHNFILPCPATDTCSWGRAVPPPPVVSNGVIPVIPPPPVSRAAPPPPPTPPLIRPLPMPGA